MKKASLLMVILLVASLLLPIVGADGTPGPWWAKSYGGSGTDVINDVKVLPDGSIIAVGYTNSTGTGGEDVLVMKLNPDGSVAWAKTYGGSGDDVASAVALAPNGDVIVAGYTYSFGAGFDDVWVLRLDSEGNVKWQKTYGGTWYDEAYAVALAPNGDVIVAGYTYSFGAYGDAWVLRLDSEGNVKWQKTYGGSSTDVALAVALAPNGDIIVAGYTLSFGAGDRDIWVLRLDADGNVKWQKTYGGSDWDKAFTVTVAENGDIIVAGDTKSFGAGGWDAWALRLDTDGNVKWQKTYGGSGTDVALAVALAENGNIIIAGWTNSSGAGNGDFWVLRLDADGNVKWQKTYGGSDWDVAYAVALAPNGDVIVAGYTESFGAYGDAWVLRLPPDGNLPECHICGDSNAAVMDTKADVENTNAILRESDAEVSVSHAEVTSPSAGVETQYSIKAVAQNHMSNAMKLLKSYKSRGIILTPAENLLSEAENAFNSGDYVKAYDYANQAFQKAEEIKDQYDGAKPELEKAKSTILAYKSEGIVLTAVESILSKAENAFNSGDYTRAYNYSVQAIQKAEEIKNQYDKAKPELEKAKSTISTYKSQGIILAPAENLLNEAQNAFNSGNYTGAYDYSEQAIQKAEEIKNQYDKAKEAISRAEGFLSPIGEAKKAFQSGDYVKAYQLALQAEAEKERRQKLFALGVVLAALIGGSSSRVHKRRERERKLKELNSIIERAEEAPLLEKIKLLKDAEKIASALGSDALGRVRKPLSSAVEEATKLLEEAIAKGDSLLSSGDYAGAIRTYESVLPIAEALGKGEFLRSKIEGSRRTLDELKKRERLKKILGEITSAVSRRDYSPLGELLKEAEKLAREIGEEGKVKALREELSTRLDNLLSRGEELELGGDYAGALSAYTEALSLAEALGRKTNRIKKAISRIEEEQKRGLLKRSIKLDVPTEMPHKAETEVSIIVTNRFSSDLALTVDLSENRDYFELSEEKIEFPRVKPGKTIGESVTVKPKFIGDFDFTVKIDSNFGSLESRIPVKVTKTARMAGGTPTPVTSTPILNPVEALQELYSDFQYIGEGGFARVYKAKRKDGKVVALKLPKTLDPAVGKAFIREITNWLHLKHPNIVELYDVNVLPVPYLEMEYCESSLARLQKPLPVDEAALIVFNIAEGLKYAHSKGIIHRDLKPSNVLLKNGLPKISDWGLSKVLEESMSATTTASFTPFYASPEQIDRKYGRTDERTDIWQLGVIFYELVTGKLPFEGSLSQVMMGILRDDPIPPSRLNPEAKKVEPIIMRMLAKRKEERYQSVDELQKDLARILNMTYSESLRESKTLGDVRRTVYYLTELLLINLKTNNAGEAYKYAGDLTYYTSGELREEVKKLAEQVKLRLEEKLDIPPELVEKAEIIAHKIRLGFEKL